MFSGMQDFDFDKFRLKFPNVIKFCPNQINFNNKIFTIGCSYISSFYH